MSQMFATDDYLFIPFGTVGSQRLCTLDGALYIALDMDEMRKAGIAKERVNMKEIEAQIKEWSKKT